MNRNQGLEGRVFRRRSVVVLALLTVLAACQDPAADPPMPALRADGTRIVDPAGNEVLLRGVNLGGWIFHETWITQVDYTLVSRIHVLGQRTSFAVDVDAALQVIGDRWGPGEEDLARFQADLATRVGEANASAFVQEVRKYLPVLYDDSDLPLRQKLSERFGDDVRDQLLDTFQDAWITDEDIAWIAAQGFNVVRVPMGYRGLVTGPDLALPASLPWNERAFDQVQRLLDSCRRHRVWAVLDLQESPGGHNGYAGEALLYSNPAMQDLVVQLWQEIVRRFGDHDAVAAYSLLAEPMGAPDAAARDAVYDRLVKAVRALGDDHLLVIHDGFFGMQTLPEPAKFGWTNVVYSTHIFEEATSYADYDFLVNYVHDVLFTEAQAKQGVPYYMGSFSTRKGDDWAYEAAQLLVDWFGKRRWSWSVWTYKRIEDPIGLELFGRRSSYGVRSVLRSGFTRPDVFEDDLATLRERFRGYRDVVLDPDPRLLGILRSDAETP